MNEDLVRELRDDADWTEKSPDFTVPTVLLYEMRKAADAIEELSKLADAIPHVCECCIGCEVESGGCDQGFVLSPKRAREYLSKPRWVSVTEALPESVDDDVLVTDGEGCAVGFWREDAKAWDSTDFGWLENRSEPPCGIHTVTHWMPLPPLPEPPKEEE